MNPIDPKIIQDAAAPTAPPSFWNSALEARAALDLAQLPLVLGNSWLKTRFKSPSNRRGRKTPVMMFPGFATDERSMKPLELFLRKQGFKTEDWGLGRNLAGSNYPHTLDDVNERWDLSLPEGFSKKNYKGEAGVPYMCDKAIDQVEKRFSETRQPLTLIGWSLGGYVAREVARALGTTKVNRVITLCAPVIGGPRYTRAVSAFESRGLDLDWIERAIDKQETKPIEQPITAIYSKTDGVVNWRAMIDKHSPKVEHFELNVSHIGVGINRKAWRIILNALNESA